MESGNRQEVEYERGLPALHETYEMSSTPSSGLPAQRPRECSRHTASDFAQIFLGCAGGQNKTRIIGLYVDQQKCIASPIHAPVPPLAMPVLIMPDVYSVSLFIETGDPFG